MATQSHNQRMDEQECLLEIIRKIHEVVELDKACQLIATEAETLLKVDRVLIYEFRGQCWGNKGQLSNCSDKLTLCLPDGLEQGCQCDRPSTLMLSDNLKGSVEIGQQITQLMVPITAKQRE